MIGSFEMIFVIVIVLVLFGPNKLPELARSIGSAMGEFKMAQKSAEFDLSGFDAIKEENQEKKEKEQQDLNAKILKMAEEAGIETDGKTPDEILELMAVQINQKSVSNVVDTVNQSEIET